MTIPATISLTESQGFTALGNFLASVTGLPAGQIIQGQQNRVSEPAATDFIIMTSLRQVRLGTNITDFFDNILTGSIAGPTLTVTDVSQSQGAGIQPGMLLVDTNWPTMNIAPNTTVVEQLTGPTGGAGTYTITPTQTLSAETLYAGLRTDLAETTWTVQLDIHGPNSGNNTKIVEALFRSDFATDFFAAQPYDVTPLHCNEARQIGFVNGEAQWEERYVMDAVMQINPVVGTPQQFFDEIVVRTIEAYPRYVEGGTAEAPNPNPPTNPGGLVPWPPVT